MSHIWSLICLPSIVIIRAPNSTPAPDDTFLFQQPEKCFAEYGTVNRENANCYEQHNIFPNATYGLMINSYYALLPSFPIPISSLPWFHF